MLKIPEIERSDTRNIAMGFCKEVTFSKPSLNFFAGWSPKGILFPNPSFLGGPPAASLPGGVGLLTTKQLGLLRWSIHANVKWMFVDGSFEILRENQLRLVGS